VCDAKVEMANGFGINFIGAGDTWLGIGDLERLRRLIEIPPLRRSISE
jgi:hypothetical protein